jgi:seryl-tRNA synthetase
MISSVFTAQDRWLEISSVSNFETFQANRLKLRFKDKDGKINWLHLTEVHWLCQGFGRNFRKPNSGRIVIPEVYVRIVGLII